MEINMKMKFAERLKELRKENGYTQVMLAEALGLSKGTVAMWETGKRTPDYEIINIMSDMFDRRIDYILGYSDDPTSPKLTQEEIEELGKWEIQSEQIHTAIFTAGCIWKNECKNTDTTGIPALS